MTYEKIPLGILDMSPVLEGASVEAALERSVQLAIMAENAGYHRFWLSEHHDMAQLACTAPEILLSHIGARTSSIRLGAGAVLLPHYRPMKVAETFRMLGALYPGRIDLGIGRAPGGSAHAAIALSGNYLSHVAQMPELVRDLRSLLQDEYKVEDTLVQARPQPAYPLECWMLGTNRKSAVLAAQNGTGYVFGYFMSGSDGEAAVEHYRANFQPSALHTEPRVILAVKVIAGQTDQEAERLYERWKTSPAGIASIGEEIPAPIVGGQQSIWQQFQELSLRYRADELLLICPLNRYQERINVYESIASWTPQPN
ncbi:MsnO8 family LLM class oxidoreductase [Paenibacillus dauci]|uniref:MsnO8 family LLM class oxidoreductase n=1 Tax=Paenibacillus dauci TaxID=1567106 RepID=UPI000619D737|nr:MsnO8 family LLM class oxidoreductase [Paenibacillus dauci]